MSGPSLALDLEFLDSPEYGREIIEIGAIRFQGDQELETYTTLVRPSAVITASLTRLTGLTTADLERALPLREALAELSELLDGAPVVGQSVTIDLEQLRRAGLTISAPVYDTFELGSLLLPGLPGYDLESIGRALGLDPGPERHRALADARLASRVFNELCERIGALDLDTLRQVNRLALPLAWPARDLFAASQAQKERSEPTAVAGLPVVPAWLRSVSTPPSRPERTRRAAAGGQPDGGMVGALRPGGLIAVELPAFELRREQLELAGAIGEVLDQGGLLLAEAGTGVGKSLAYLLPAAARAVEHGERTVVATSTITLQDQLADQELPLLQRALDGSFTFAVLKGRGNYLCLRRWLALLQTEDLSNEERSLLIKTLLWLPLTQTGDRVELRLVGREEEAWQRVSATVEACTPGRCTFHRQGSCFVARARRAAEASDIVVVNQALLVADSQSDGRSRVLPDYSVLVVDEAHHLEDEATAQLGWLLGERELTDSLESLTLTSEAGLRGLVERAGSMLGPGEAFEELRASLVETATQLGERLRQLFQLLRRFAREHGQRLEPRVSSARLTAVSRAQPAWSRIEVCWDDQRPGVERLLDLLRELELELAGAPEQTDRWEALTGELANRIAHWERVADRLDALLLSGGADQIAWISIGRNDELVLNAAPLRVGAELNRLLTAPRATVLTGATLTVDRSFAFLRGRLGIDEARELVIGSPYDYAKAALVYLPSDMPEPNSPGFQSSVERVSGQLIAALEGRTLVLFTAHNQLRVTYQALKPALEARQIELLGQRMDGVSRSRLLERFRRGDRVALMGTTSYWEGVDVVGEALSCLILTRLPFNSPADPIFEARAAEFDDPFEEYSVPLAILRFRQGFGRLLRSGNDRGVVVVLDRRLRSRPYGRAFLDSLPGPTVVDGPASQAAAAAREWLGRASEHREGAAVH